jgi:ferredoxin
MKVWVDHDLCTGDGLCEEICPSMFAMVDGVSHVLVGGQPSDGMADVPDHSLDHVLDAAEECPGECIFIEA